MILEVYKTSQAIEIGRTKVELPKEFIGTGWRRRKKKQKKMR